MTVFESMTLMISFACLIIAVLTFNQNK
ncbi:putative holin-like toxin [Bacillus methanolicus]